MAQFDTEMADGIWDGAVAPEGAPGWYHEVATLISIARADVQPGELAGEGEVVARMRAALLEATDPDTTATDGVPGRVASRAGLKVAGRLVLTLLAGGADGARADDPTERMASSNGAERPAKDRDLAVLLRRAPGRGRERPRHMAGTAGANAAAAGVHASRAEARPSGPRSRTSGPLDRHAGRFVRRLVAVKAVAVTTALALGITAAAATTGIVTVVVPAARDRLLTDESSEQPGDDGSVGAGSADTAGPCADGASRCDIGHSETTSTTAASQTPTSLVPGTGTTETTLAADGTTTSVPGDATSTTAGPLVASPPTTATTTTLPPDTTSTTTPTTVGTLSVPGEHAASGPGKSELAMTRASPAAVTRRAWPG